jgi:phosphoserine phosphatase
MAPRIWAGTRRLAQRHLESGERVWLVSAAPVEIGRVIAARLGLTGAIGTVAEVIDGTYTGRLVGDLMHGPAKVEAVTQLAEVEGLDLARCAAYSDSVNDLPMLSAVGRAVAINPDGMLLRQARERGWEVRDFRTGRRAVKIAVPSTAAAGLLAGAVTAGLALHRRRRAVL